MVTLINLRNPACRESRTDLIPCDCWPQFMAFLHRPLAPWARSILRGFSVRSSSSLKSVTFLRSPVPNLLLACLPLGGVVSKKKVLSPFRDRALRGRKGRGRLSVGAFDLK